MTIIAQHLNGSWEIHEAGDLSAASRAELRSLVETNRRFPDSRILTREEAVFSEGYNWYEWEYSEKRKRVFYRLVSGVPSHAELLKELEALTLVGGY